MRLKKFIQNSQSSSTIPLFEHDSANITNYHFVYTKITTAHTDYVTTLIIIVNLVIFITNIE